MQRRARIAGPTIALLAAFACGESGAGDGLAAASAANGVGQPHVYGTGIDRSSPRSPCMEREEYRQFDFWLGEWAVVNAAGAAAGTNIIESTLDGCALQEHWVGAGGGAGRSINAWDRDTGRWHQTWVSSNDMGHLRMSGGWTGARLEMGGVRTEPDAVERLDDYTWTPEGPDRLVQTGSLRIPAQGVDSRFALTYHRVADMAQDAPVPTIHCLEGGRSSVIRDLDFWLGQWRVERPNGARLGTASVVSDLSGCLTVETFETAEGHSAISYTYFDIVENAVYRTYIDSEGERVELRGGFDGAALVLTATEPGPAGASVHVRNTLQQLESDLVEQRWAVSRDDGATWTEDLVLHYRRS